MVTQAIFHYNLQWFNEIEKLCCYITGPFKKLLQGFSNFIFMVLMHFEFRQREQKIKISSLVTRNKSFCLASSGKLSFQRIKLGRGKLLLNVTHYQ